MKENNNIFIVGSARASKLESAAGVKMTVIPRENLHNKDEKYDNAIVFIDNNPGNFSKIREEVKEILLLNPGINFILYYDEPLPPSQLVQFVQSGITEFVSLDEPDQIKDLIKRFEIMGGESQLNYFNNLVSRFRDIGIITNHSGMAEIFSKIEKIAQSNSTVLISGENGTGKELIARAVHFFSPRRSSKFVGVNTGAIPENLLEDELFGHVKGSFTSALKDRKGKFEYA
ncbi:MAG TPA: sigma 54-interacting transcriptional regulator, partial [Candidatus Deferrimicrobium sp.]|nr:sigma 54-interacting transcriptional regulator [Candidatus Deferrimicrobium sp.]